MKSLLPQNPVGFGMWDRLPAYFPKKQAGRLHHFGQIQPDFAAIVKSWLLMLISMTVLTSASTADEAAQEDAADVGTVLQAPPGFVVAGTNIVPRDPFWPLGYVPPSLLKTPEDEQQDGTEDKVPEVEIVWPQLLLKGITRKAQGDYIGLIDGAGLVERGDIIRMRRGGVVYRWHVENVSSDGVETRRLDAEPAAADGPGSDR